MPFQPHLALILAIPALAAECGRAPRGFAPLDDPFYLSHSGAAEGGLYPGGRNAAPVALRTLMQRAAASIQPLDAAGSPAANGRVVLLSAGMSNTTQEFSAFLNLLRVLPGRHPQLTAVDGAQGGWSVERILAEPGPYWTEVERRLRAAGAAPAQVQTVWMKQAHAGPNRPFPENARRLEADLREFVREHKRRLPNLQIVYLSSRIYAGYAASTLNPEPHAYESGFAVKWLIESQLSGDAGPAGMPVMAWGPYLWADGLNMRDDGLVWTCADFAEDGTHPSEQARTKVARMLLDFFLAEQTARPWFLAPAASAPAARIAAVVNAASGSKPVANGSIASIYGSNLARAAEAATTLPLPTSLGGASVLVEGVAAPLYYASPTQINFVMSKMGGKVTVVRDGVAWDSVDLEAALYAPGIFTSAGAAAVRIVGDVVEVYATGFGVRHPLMLRPDNLPAAALNGQRAEVLYSGPAPGWPGLNQLNFRIPYGAPRGVPLPLSIAFGSSESNRATLTLP